MSETVNNAFVQGRLTQGGHVKDPAYRVSASFALLGLIAASVLVLLGGEKLMGDPDTLWHIRVGADIWTWQAFPTTDVYSHTFFGEQWIAKQWLSEILLAGAHGIAGWGGVALLSAGALIWAYWILYESLAHRLKPTIAIGVALWMFAMASGAFLARPHSLALPIALLFVRAVWFRAAKGDAPPWRGLVLLALWANLHGGFTLGFIVAFFGFVQFVFVRRYWRIEAFWRQRDFLQWMGFLALLPLAAMVHPYGFQSIWSTFLITESPMLDHIKEWRAFSISGEPLVGAHILGAFFVLCVARVRISVAASALLVFLLFLYMEHVRFGMYLFLMSPIVLAATLDVSFKEVARSTWWRSAPADGIENFFARFPARTIQGLSAVFALTYGASFILSDIRPSENSYPLDAITSAKNADVKGTVLNAYNFGGALLYEGIPTFVDGRADRLFDNGAFIADFLLSVNEPKAFEKYVAEYGVGWTLLKPEDEIAIYLDERSDWQRVYADEFAVVHELMK